MIIDTHAHVNFNAFEKDREQVIEECLNNDVYMINVGSNFFNSKKAVEIANQYEEGVYAAVGIHPIHLNTDLIKIKHDPEEGELAKEDFNKDKFKSLINHKVVAIGEIGLDHYWKPKTKIRLSEFKRLQRELFIQQLDFATGVKLPVILHCRMAHDDMLEVLQDYNFQYGGVIHCFTGDLEQAQKYMDLGFHIGLNGIIFKFDIDDVIRGIPEDKILFETDCPYLSPPDYKRRNDPMGVMLIKERVEDLRNAGVNGFKNAASLFDIS